MAHGTLQKRNALRIRSARQAARLTQSELAAALDLGRSAVAQWQDAAGSAPSTASFARLATTLGCTFEWLATGHGPRSVAHRNRVGDDDPEPAVRYRHFAHSDEEERMIEAFRALDDFDRAAVMALTETLSARPPATRPPRPPAAVAAQDAHEKEKPAAIRAVTAAASASASEAPCDGPAHGGVAPEAPTINRIQIVSA